MPPAILMTQCLQNDFIKPIGRHDALPNGLHVGSEEARRLMGSKPSEGPVAHVMRWAYAQDEARLKIIHIRDWHDAHDPAQASHLARFGAHCLRDARGSRFAFEEPAGSVTPSTPSLSTNQARSRSAGLFTRRDYAGRESRIGSRKWIGGRHDAVGLEGAAAGPGPRYL